MRPPELSSTHSRYPVAAATAFHVKVGVAVAMLPDGASSVAGPGGTTTTLLTVTATAAEIVALPAASRALAVSVCGPLAAVVVSPEEGEGVAVFSGPRFAPSIWKFT